MAEYQVKLRLFLFQITILLVFGLFTIQLWRLQFVQGAQYQALADVNRFRSVTIDAPRGIIYDRYGQLLVRNRPIFNIAIIPAFLPEEDTERAEVYARLANLLQLPITNAGERQIASHNAYFRAFLHHEYTRLPNRQVKNSRSRRLQETPKGIKDAVDSAPPFAPYRPVVIAEDIASHVAAIIEEDRLNLPGVIVETDSIREYLTGKMTSQILGYVGPISPERLANYPEPRYNQNDLVGLVGIEAEYEDQLHGIKGNETIEVDVTGRKMRTVGDKVSAQPGNNLTLTIDLELQEQATFALQAAIDRSGGESGAAIIMDPNTGQILAMVSLPSYDNNLFAQGISAREYGLLSQNEATPLVNKAITGLYPPASTFKPVVAAGALEENIVAPNTLFLDQGILYLPNEFFPDDLDLAQPFFGWKEDGLGEVNVVSALGWSSNIYFYLVGGGYYPTEFEGLGLENLIRYSEIFGYSNLTGIDLPGEVPGLIPTEKWKRLNYAEVWVTGDTYNMAIGQGYVLATPLQVLNAYAAIANGGTRYKPYLVQEIRSPLGEQIYQAQPEVIGRLAVDEGTISWIKQGLNGVVDWGTAALTEAINVPGVNVAGKTGTADFCKRYPQCLDRNGRVRDKHAWFVGYAPRENPEVIAVVFVYDGGEGSVVAAPTVNQILRYYFGLDREVEEADQNPKTATLAEDAQFHAHLLGIDTLLGNAAAVSGYVFDQRGEGLGNLTLDILGDDQLIAQVTTNLNGSFEYNTIDPSLFEMIKVQPTNYQTPEPLEIAVNQGMRYYLEFQLIDTTQEANAGNGAG